MNLSILPNLKLLIMCIIISFYITPPNADTKAAIQWYDGLICVLISDVIKSFCGGVGVYTVKIKL